MTRDHIQHFGNGELYTAQREFQQYENHHQNP